ncbi:EamA family transporter [Sediminibacterium ginsengisoli]|uniref:Inner membrane transporter RhtA n=1 Tax=Sediminibacterium ginsengisoli TaxID=413434 RepID=A0A1T4M8S7_9BACT|nr:DMT family transporter [Sediminibacterium ginsengisoli]SJZ63440.1 inner membrane transporter RhtA [Sediminibacterium ginsengisoli]
MKKQLPPIPAVLLAIVSVQGGAAVAKGLFPALGSGGTAAIRTSLSCIILLAIFRPNLRKLTAQQWKAVVPYGLALGTMNLVFYLALERIPLGIAVTLEFVGPLVLAVTGSRKLQDLLWVVMAAAGIVLIAPWSIAGNIDMVGALLALLAGTLWAFYIVLGGRVSRVLPGGAAVSIGMIFATLVVLPFGIAGGGLTQLTPVLLLAGAGVAILSGALPYSLEMQALRQLPARTFSILMSLEPAVASVFSFLFLNEHFSFSEWLAVILIVAASAGAAITAKKKTVSDV